MDTSSRLLLHLAKHPWRRSTMRGLAVALKMPYTTLHRTVKETAELLVIEEVGKAKTIALDLSHPVLASRLAIASWEERKEFLERRPIIRKIADENRDGVLLLFGSYAKGTQREGSDIDLLVIDGKQGASFAKYELLYKKKVNPLSITEEEFLLMLREREENVGKQALESHIILNGPERFWGPALSALREGALHETVR